MRVSNLYAPGTFTGNYIPKGDISGADCVIGHEFAYRKTGFGNVNELLAEFIANRFSDLPLFLNRNIAGALHGIDPTVTPEAIFSGESSNLTATSGEGTWGELTQARHLMNERGWNKPIHVAQAYHVGRVALQAKLLEMESIVPDGLPRDFDRESEQIWTKAASLWAFHELLGAPVLRHRDQL